MDQDAIRVADAILGNTPPMTLDEMQAYIAEWAERKGWGFDGTSIPEKLMLIVSELSEALEEYRHGNPPHITYYKANTMETGEILKPEGIPSEMADAVIRILHFCGNFKFSLQDAIVHKMAYNEKRPPRHGGKLA